MAVTKEMFIGDYYHISLIHRDLKKKGVSHKGMKKVEIAETHSRLYGYDLTKFKTKSGAFNNKRAEKYFKRILALRKKEIEKEFRYTDEYKDYLKSPKWKAIRESIISLSKSCERCGSTERLQVHHKTYDRIFNEDYDDLELLCATCHSKEHSNKDYSKQL